jgi:hypothetical protein
MLDHDRIESDSALTFREASQYLQISRSQLYYLIFARLVNPRVLRGRYIFLIEDLDDVKRYLGWFRWPQGSREDYQIYRDHLPYR